MGWVLLVSLWICVPAYPNGSPWSEPDLTPPKSLLSSQPSHLCSALLVTAAVATLTWWWSGQIREWGREAYVARVGVRLASDASGIPRKLTDRDFDDLALLVRERIVRFHFSEEERVQGILEYLGAYEEIDPALVRSALVQNGFPSNTVELRAQFRAQFKTYEDRRLLEVLKAVAKGAHQRLLKNGKQTGLGEGIAYADRVVFNADLNGIAMAIESDKRRLYERVSRRIGTLRSDSQIDEEIDAVFKDAWKTRRLRILFGEAGAKDAVRVRVQTLVKLATHDWDGSLIVQAATGPKQYQTVSDVVSEIQETNWSAVRRQYLAQWRPDPELLSVLAYLNGQRAQAGLEPLQYTAAISWHSEVACINGSTEYSTQSVFESLGASPKEAVSRMVGAPGEIRMHLNPSIQGVGLAWGKGKLYVHFVP